MERYSELKEKEVIDVADGKRLGHIIDLEIDICCGKIAAIIAAGKQTSMFKREETIINWHQIKKIGDDIILVHRTPEGCFDHPHPPPCAKH